MSRKKSRRPMSHICCCIPDQQPMGCCMPQPQPQVVCCCTPQGTSGVKNKSACSFPCLIILILILLVFGKSGRSCDDPCSVGNRSGFGMDIGILFIIALFYLSCVSPCNN
ncbi:hypothetical protein SAMN02745248_01916 [Hathewaya proteolytica DSM 3090]|uniref:Uncharacterized protein n=1 Tax=Hathewaya proteolytica DSM 3090 TaxID=1121331 RepID=A0A1M6Q6P3_9CLOT|nr:hypothetical protein [Hathewaya proteolytica]SHK15818.1 hypothetical protein SAMN02745248_01916 [Hathewaya proteolytica DSM 3090]